MTPRSPHRRRPAPAYTGAVGVALVFVLVIAGLLLIPSMPLAGVVVIALGYGVSRLVGGRSESSFTAGLMVLGGLGAVAVIAQYLTAML